MTGSQRSGGNVAEGRPMDDDEAMMWAVRVGDPAFDDWDGFTRWLEADVGRSARYDAAVAAIAAAEVLVAQVAPTEVVREPQVRAHPLRWAGAALAAALVGGIGLNAWTGREQPYAVEAAAGQQRAVRLADGSEVLVAGGSRVRLDRADPRRATVERGEVLFRIRHDAAHPFRVQAGGIALTDIGTVFDVKHYRTNTRVAVAEGAVLVDPDGAALRLDPGQAVIAEGDRLTQTAVDVADVGGWQQGRLAFDGTSLAEVADDLARQLGRRVTVAPSIAARPFRGTLDVGRLRSEPATLGALLGVHVRTDGGDWVLEPLG